jgi:small GTP-binding protein
MTKQIIGGLVAHVDAGKTTLTEALLYQAGQLRQLGRVDKGSSFLDPDQLEKQRGITIFTHQAALDYQKLHLTLLDTPGHIDFAAQTEQVLQVLDYAVLVISATDGLQGSTRTLWDLLAQYHVPTFIFINKTDSVGADVPAVIKQLQSSLSAACVDFTGKTPTTGATAEAIAMQDDAVLESYLANDCLTEQQVQSLIQQRKLFPCYAGSALKLTGIQELLDGLAQWTVETPSTGDQFAARVFKISHDDRGNRLSWVRVLSGQLVAKREVLPGEKADQLRVYNGSKFSIQQSIPAGGVCAITGLTSSYPGQGLGQATTAPQPRLKPVLSYAIKIDNDNPRPYLAALRELADEEPQLKVEWLSELQEARVQLMGTVQKEVLEQLLAQRYGLQVQFTNGQILYRETIDRPVEGVGHFEPLRHYAEVHLRLEPAPRGSGLTFTSHCREEVLSHNWQQQVMASLGAKEHRGVLIGAPLTDVQITLVGGKGSIVHSVGGDFREATWRAVRQGLMELRAQKWCVLLEPWYHYRLTVPQEEVGRAINDLQQMGADFKLTESGAGPLTTITGSGPVATMRDYAITVRNYSRGQGQLECVVDGYRPCHNAAEVITDHQYDPVADLPNTPDSVFCAHGAGYPVKWDQVPAMAHFPYQK